MRVYVVAHAIWVLDRHLDAIDETQPNIVERRVTPALIRWHPDDNTAWWKLFCALGGPEIDRFLLRQIEAEAAGARERSNWVYILADRRDRAGRRFREQYPDLLLELADALAPRVGSFVFGGHSWFMLENDLDFLFLDLDRGSQSPAICFWPRFQEIADAEAGKGITWYYESGRELHPRPSLLWRWNYLLKMEPLSTVEMYVDSWRSSPVYAYFWCRKDPEVSGGRDSPFPELRRLPKAKRKEVVEALIREVERDASNLIGQSEKDDENELRKDVLKTLRSLLNEESRSSR